MGLTYPLEISRVSPARRSSLFDHIINPLLPKPVRSRWLDIGQVHFCVQQKRKNELGQYPAIFTSRSANNTYIIFDY